MRLKIRVPLFALVLCASLNATEWTGVVSESGCGAKHSTGSALDKACVAKCIRGGGQPVFVLGQKVYRIDNPASTKGHEGEKVRIAGKLTGDAIHIDTITSAQN